MAFKKKDDAPAKPENPAVVALRAQKAKMLKAIDEEAATTRRAVQMASTELSRARHALDLHYRNRKTMVETFDALIASAADS